jgi:hypothetical protein
MKPRSLWTAAASALAITLLAPPPAFGEKLLMAPGADHLLLGPGGDDARVLDRCRPLHGGGQALPRHVWMPRQCRKNLWFSAARIRVPTCVRP